MLEISLGAGIRVTSKKHVVRYTSKFYKPSEPTGSDYRQFPHKIMSPSHILPVVIGLLQDAVGVSSYAAHRSVFSLATGHAQYFH
jgi:hypothetical protein